MPRITMTTKSSMRVKPSSEPSRVLMRSNMVLGLLPRGNWGWCCPSRHRPEWKEGNSPERGRRTTSFEWGTLLLRARQDERDEIVDLRRGETHTAVGRHLDAPCTGLRDVRARVGDRLLDEGGERHVVIG